MSETAIGIDIGGTKVAAGLIHATGAIIESSDTPTDESRLEQTVLELIDHVSATSREPVGIAFAGWVEHSTGSVALAPNLPSVDPEFARRVREQTDRYTVIENDVNAAAWAEYKVGAARGCASMVMFAVGTGVGGAAIVNHALMRGSRGFAGEFGHMTVIADGGPQCACGQRGCLESVASGDCLGRIARERLGDAPQSLVNKLVKGDTSKVNGETVTGAAQAGDTFAVGIVAEVGRYLGVGMSTIVHAFDPEVVVVGGGVCAAGDLLLGPTRKELERRFQGKPPPPPVLLATFGNDAGMIGAGLLALGK